MGVTCVIRGAFVLVLAAGLPLGAEQPPVTDERPVTVTQGRDLADFYVVGKFFRTVDFSYRNPGIRERFRRDLDVAEGSEAEKVLLLAAYASEAITTEPLDLSPWANDPAGSKRIQHDHTRSQVRRLGKVWREFLRDWKNAGQSEEAVLEYLDTRSRHQVQLYTIGASTDEDQREHDEIMAEFHNPDAKN
jgi:hypothetical protein